MKERSKKNLTLSVASCIEAAQSESRLRRGALRFLDSEQINHVVVAITIVLCRSAGAYGQPVMTCVFSGGGNGGGSVAPPPGAHIWGTSGIA